MIDLHLLDTLLPVNSAGSFFIVKIGKRTVKITFLLLLIIAAAVDIAVSQKFLSLQQYNYSNLKVKTGVRIVQLSDLHNYQFGKNNSRLIGKIYEQTPDMILMTGDMLNGDDDSLNSLLSVVRQCVQIAPVYFSYGNHEKEYVGKFVSDEEFRAQIEQAGACVLDKEYADIRVNGQEIRIGGIYGYVLSDTSEAGDRSEQIFMKEFTDTDRLKILLSHIPEGLLLWKSMERWDVDLIFSGHVHGGQVRLPFMGGLYDPEEGYFPEYTKGIFQCGYGTMILSGGLGSSRGVPRVNNLPELVVCQIIPPKG